MRYFSPFLMIVFWFLLFTFKLCLFNQIYKLKLLIQDVIKLIAS